MISQQLKIETRDLNIGMVALTDCAPLVIAKRLGYFEQWGLNVELHVQPSWATLRDRLQTGILDAAQMLAPMPLASTLGLQGPKVEMLTAFNLSMNGNGITLSNIIVDEISKLNNNELPDLPLDSSWLLKLIEEGKINRKLKFAVVFPFSCHHYQLIDWLSEAGIEVNDMIEVVVIPPTEMTQALQHNDIDGFCVGNPWNAKAVRQGIGTTVITSCDIWQEAPEKVLTVNKAWQEQNPNTFMAMLAAVQQACEWLDSKANRFEAALMLTDYINEPLEVIAPSLIGSCITSAHTPARDIPAYNRFISADANIPKRVQGQTLLEKMRENKQLPGAFSQEEMNQVLNQVYRKDLYLAMVDLRQKMTQ